MADQSSLKSSNSRGLFSVPDSDCMVENTDGIEPPDRSRSRVNHLGGGMGSSALLPSDNPTCTTCGYCLPSGLRMKANFCPACGVATGRPITVLRKTRQSHPNKVRYESKYVQCTKFNG